MIEKEIRQTATFIIMSDNIQCVVICLAKEVKDRMIKNFQYLEKEIEKAK